MIIPSATYRLQFRDGMTFDRSIEIIPHLKALGISHLYASPIFTATTGSSHGYDVIDANAIDPALGGRAGFDRMVEALRQAGLGLILDIVPNHMAASVENSWWQDVLRHGDASRYAHHFDIDWSERLTLPVLGKPLQEALEAGELEVVRGNGDFPWQLKYFETLLPLSNESLVWLDAEINGVDAGDEWLLKSSQSAAWMERLLELQHWQLVFWKDAARHLSYRRFFEVTGLVGIRVEDENVFNDTHRLVMELLKAGQVQGLRIDHIDGLANPTEYLDRLRKASGPDIYITVEKILGPDEKLPSHWPVAGTTGYEFISALSHVFINENGLSDLQREYRKIAPESADFEQGLRTTKQLMVDYNFEGEVDRLTGLAHAVAPEIDRLAVKDGIQKLLTAFPVYRTYGHQGPVSNQDKAVLGISFGQAWGDAGNSAACELLKRLMLGEVDGHIAQEFRARFQQVSGPVMAKALEDTLFYRYNRLIAANEVGGDPNEEADGISSFHASMLERVISQPNGLSATSTHDTKRGEDARARLYTLSEGSDIWAESVDRWRGLNRKFVSSLADGLAPEPNVEWMLYQSLAGIWPQSGDHCDLETLRDRFVHYAEKAVREAKLRTNWSEPKEDYEAAVLAYAGALLSPDNKAFLSDFADTIRPFVAAGCLNTLSQTLIKLTAPGVPDIYQGTEGFDLSLVDPDNRRPLDLKTLVTRGAIASDQQRPPEARKSELIEKTLNFRRNHFQLFAEGQYRPLETAGRRKDHVVAFARSHDGMVAITIVPRLVFGQIDAGKTRILSDFWEDTIVFLPDDLTQPLHDLLTGAAFEGQKIRLAETLSTQDVSLLVSSKPMSSAKE